MTEKFKSAHLVEGSVIQTSLRNEKRNADEGGALAPAQAQVHVPAHAQHTTAQHVPIRISTFRGFRLYSRGVRTYTPAQLRKALADLHAKGYVFASIRVYTTTVYDEDSVPRYVPAYTIILDRYHWQNVPAGHISEDSLAYDYRMPTEEGRE